MGGSLGKVKVALTQTLLEGVDMLVSSGLYTSRGEVVREAVRRLIRREERSARL